jgi:hypothetical protein
MLEPADGELRRYQCIGYATFTARLEADPAFTRRFQRLSDETGALGDPAPGQLDWLISVQHALVVVIKFLDPDGLRSAPTWHASSSCSAETKAHFSDPATPDTPGP